MKTIIGNNNIVVVENLDGSFNEEIELEQNTALITGNDAHEFDTQEQLITFIAGQNALKFQTIPNEGEKCEENKIYAYGTDKVKCLQEHIRMHYSPEQTPALWLIVPTVTEGYPDWVQPLGAHDAYQIGDKVSHNGKNYESVIDANVWSPIVYTAGWKEI